ncbi:MAG: hypothetical protein JXB34_15055 [Bacteroidales bacterium]|nr:hypothetical protein [Bacteroidales bacterium]
MKLKSAFLILVCSALFLPACKQSTDKLSDSEKGDKISQEEIQKSVEEVIFPLPEPMGVYKMLQDIGASYVGNVLNPAGSVSKYFKANDKAVNLGVYAADLSYAVVYEKKNDADAYTKIVKQLIDDLDIDIDYKSLTSDETKEKAANTDSLVKITSQVFYDTYEFLYSKSDPALAALMVNGFYVEGLYIATHISKDTYDNVEMVKIIYGQAKPLEELIKLNEKFAGNEYIKALQGTLLKLKELYDATDGSLTKEQLKAITSTIATIRESMVS